MQHLHAGVAVSKINLIWQKIAPFSLRMRLTVGGIVAVFAVGVGSIALWTTWQMQQILINSHKENIEQIADRLLGDVEVASHSNSAECWLCIARLDRKILGDRFV